MSAMNMWLVLEKVGIIFALMLLGYAYGKLSKQKDPSAISRLVLNVSVPCSILSTITAADYDAVRADLPVLIIVSAGVTLATLPIGFAFTRVFKMGKEKAIYRSVIFFNNYGFMGWPICQVLLGNQGFLYAALYAIPIHLLAYGITPVLMRASGGGKLFDRSTLVNLPLYATVAALAVLMSGLALPEGVTEVLSMVGGTQTPLSMIAIGMILAGANLKEAASGYKPYAYAALRLLILPAAVYLILRGMGLNGLLLKVPAVISAMPAASMVVVLAQKHGADSLLASRLIVISTLLSVATIPLISMLVL